MLVICVVGGRLVERFRGNFFFSVTPILRSHERGKRVIYTDLDKALYGTLQAAVLFWRILSAFLIHDLGFTVNPYGSCVVNKQIDGGQFTICWQMDDLKLSHKSDHVVTDIIHHL